MSPRSQVNRPLPNKEGGILPEWDWEVKCPSWRGYDPWMRTGLEDAAGPPEGLAPSAQLERQQRASARALAATTGLTILAHLLYCLPLLSTSGSVMYSSARSQTVPGFCEYCRVPVIGMLSRPPGFNRPHWPL